MALEGGEGPATRPGPLFTPRKTRYRLYRKLGGPEGRSRHVWKISPPPGFDSRTVQLGASRYTGWATGPTLWCRYLYMFLLELEIFRRISQWKWKHNLCSGIIFPKNRAVYEITAKNQKILCYISTVTMVTLTRHNATLYYIACLFQALCLTSKHNITSEAIYV